jgi:hypothetical protein
LLGVLNVIHTDVTVNRSRNKSGEHALAQPVTAHARAEKSVVPARSTLEQVGEILRLLQLALDESRKTNDHVQAELERARWHERQNESVQTESSVTLDRPRTQQREIPRARVDSGVVVLSSDSAPMRGKVKASR